MNPNNDPCLLACLVKVYGDSVWADWFEFCKIIGVTKGWVARNKISLWNKITKFAFINIVEDNRIRLTHKDGICVYIYENHYCLIKKSNKTKKAIESIKQNFTKVKLDIRQLKGMPISVQEYKAVPKYTTDPLHNVYVYDLETIQIEGKLNTFAMGLLSLSDSIVWENTKIYYGYDCILNGLLYLNELHKDRQEIKIKGKKVMVKQCLTLYAHNGKGFDAYQIMSDEYILKHPVI